MKMDASGGFVIWLCGWWILEKVAVVAALMIFLLRESGG
jgi:hypothetical protein